MVLLSWLFAISLHRAANARPFARKSSGSCFGVRVMLQSCTLARIHTTLAAQPQLTWSYGASRPRAPWSDGSDQYAYAVNARVPDRDGKIAKPSRGGFRAACP